MEHFDRLMPRIRHMLAYGMTRDAIVRELATEYDMYDIYLAYTAGKMLHDMDEEVG